MRTAELRLFTILVSAMGAIVIATYWLVLRAHPVDSWVLLRGAIILTGTVICVALSLLGLRRESKQHGSQILEQALACILADTHEALPSPPDAAVAPLVTTVRQHVDALRSRLAQTQVQRKDLEIQLRLADAERRQAQTMINGISDAVLVTNDFDELIVANSPACSLFKFNLPANRKPAAEILAGTNLAENISELRHNHSRTNRRTSEVTLPLDGADHTFSVTMSSVLDSANQFASVVTVLHDVTRENDVSRMKSDFVSHVSHELRTPLSSIKAYAELLVDGEAADDKTRQEFYHVIQSEADRLSRLIDNILNISRIEADMTRVTKRPVSLTTILKEVLEVALPSAREKNITLLDRIAPAFFQIDADRDMIYQAALNLISNAIKYTPAGGSVKVTCFLDEPQNLASVEITDTGVGIPPDAMKHLFEKFYRVEQHKNMAKGSGLGLNLTRQLIESVHKGKMIVRSELGKGSTFGFTLPVTQ